MEFVNSDPQLSYEPGSHTGTKPMVRGVVLCGAASLLLYFVLLGISSGFSQEVDQLDRPLFLTVGLFARIRS